MFRARVTRWPRWRPRRWLPVPPPPDAARLANAAAGIVVGKVGTAVAHTAEVPQLTLLPGGSIALVDSSEYAIKVIDASGETVRVIERPIEAERVTGEHRAAERVRRGGFLGEALPTGDSVELDEDLEDLAELAQQLLAAESSSVFWEVIPVVRGLKATWDGGLWVRRRGAEPHASDGPIDVLGPSGGYLGTLPAGEPMPWAFGPGGLAAYLEKDENDVDVVVVRRLSAG